MCHFSRGREKNALLIVNYIEDIFNINEEDTNSKRYNLRNADFVLSRFKTVAYENILSGFQTTTVVTIKQGGEKYRNFGSFQDNDTQKGCNINC